MVDALPPDAISISDLARKRNVSKQAIHKRINALVQEGKLQSFRSAEGRRVVSEAAFDFAVGQTGDPVKEAAAATSALLRGDDIQGVSTPPGETEPSAFRDAKARDAYYTAELRRLAFERENGRLWSVEEIEAALVRLGDTIKSETKTFVTRAEDGAEAYEKGMPTFRRWLAQLGEDLCRACAANLRVVAATPAEEDEASEEMPVPDELSDSP